MSRALALAEISGTVILITKSKCVTDFRSYFARFLPQLKNPRTRKAMSCLLGSPSWQVQYCANPGHGLQKNRTEENKESGINGSKLKAIPKTHVPFLHHTLQLTFFSLGTT